uniref:Uncharacterized protein n=1 Tax=Populus trichocarpa TaxID=3694 RepID=A0A3N7F4W7_POPTR
MPSCILLDLNVKVVGLVHLYPLLSPVHGASCLMPIRNQFVAKFF